MKLVLIGVIIAVIGAIGFELVEVALKNNLIPISFTVETLFEEGLEMLGTSTIIFGLLKYMEKMGKKNGQNKAQNR